MADWILPILAGIGVVAAFYIFLIEIPERRFQKRWEKNHKEGKPQDWPTSETGIM